MLAAPSYLSPHPGVWKSGGRSVFSFPPMRASLAVSPSSLGPISDANSGSPLGDLLGGAIGLRLLPGLGFGGYLIKLVRIVTSTLNHYSSSPANCLRNIFCQRNPRVSIR